MRLNILRTILLALIMFLPAYQAPGSVTPPVKNTPRHVLLITMDTTRTSHLGCYGYHLDTSPVLDKLAQESVLFENTIAQAAVTPVSHASILTGLNPFNHGVRVLHGKGHNYLKKRKKSLATIWKSAGGKTAAFLSAYTVCKKFGLNQGFDNFHENFCKKKGNIVPSTGVVNTGMAQCSAKKTTDKAIDFLNQKVKKSDSNFIWVHYFDPHDPMILPPKNILTKFQPQSSSREDILKAIYDAEIFYMDQQIGRLFSTLKSRGLWDDTIVVVVADHGEGLGDHNWWTHGILYQEQIHVPLIIRVPGKKSGYRETSLVRTIDIMPTVLDLAEIDRGLWPRMDGVSLKTTVISHQKPPSLVAYSDSINILDYCRWDHPGELDRKNDKYYTLIKDHYKVIYHQLHPENTEFYDLKSDPGEKTNLASRRTSQMNHMISLIKSMKALSSIMPAKSGSNSDFMNKLKNLGYIQ